MDSSKKWCVEPDLDDLFNDPTMLTLMRRDKVGEPELRQLVDAIRHQTMRRPIGCAPNR